MSVIVDIVARIRELAETGSRSDRRIAAVVLADLDWATNAPIAEIAARADVSEPTVTRFCRTLGCDGIRAFKLLLAQALAVGGAYLRADAQEPAHSDSWLVENVCDGAVEAVQRLRTTLDPEALKRTGSLIAGAGLVLAFGSGGTSSMAAVELQNRLFRLGLHAVAHVDGEMQRMTAASGNNRTVLVVFSISGAVKSQKDAAWITQQYGGRVIAVTATGSELAAGSDLVIPFAVQEDGGLYRPSSSRFAMLAVVDMLAMATAEAIGPSSLETLRRIKQNLNVLKVDDPRLPIGD
ncbi:MurR/RpiR family transcriptional regulator [Pleomorphomonas sp. PLEO]|uniref:MurR/RpiR family transcriptional regulator n=1 Tax=Pleomorphomonas sp. PLEO TaxID=3239306 RepID=UPI00351F44FA